MNQYNALYFVNDVVVYKALLAKEKGGKLVYKMSIVNVVSAFVSNLTILTFSKDMGWDLLGSLWIELQCGRVGGGGFSPSGGKAQRWGGGFKSEDTMVNLNAMDFSK